MDNVNELFNDTNLYSKERFGVFKLSEDEKSCTLDKKELKRLLDWIGFGDNKVITKCNNCNKEFPFDYIVKFVSFYTTSNNKKTFSFSDNISIRLFENKYLTIDVENRLAHFDGPENIPVDYLEDKTWFLTYYLTCTNCSLPYTMYVSLEQKGTMFIVRKIGQLPSILDIHGFDFSIYKKQLEKLDAYDDYKKADLSYTEHFYVGSFAYLRRIFEKMIHKYLSETEEKPDDNHMESKIKLIKNRFEPRIQDSLKNLYEVLSASIHELSEEQSKDFYVLLKAIIDMQLEYEKTIDEKDQTALKYSKELDKLKHKIKVDLDSKNK